MITGIPAANQCIVCDEAAARPLWLVAGHQLYTCVRCGMVFVSPVPSPAELAQFYATSYAVPFERDARNQRRAAARIADLERWRPQRGRLLEVGASYGHGLAAARTRGWNVVGIELSPTAAAYGRQHLRLDVYQADLLDAPLAEGRFDAAVLWHVLEHTHDPRTQLDRLLALLRPGGILGLRVPNMHSFGARVAGRSWPWIAPPGHLWYFSPHTLPRLLARCGFEVLDVRTLRGDGENPYYHMVAGLGSRANALRRILARSRASSGAAPGTPNPPQLQGAWLRLLGRARPVTAALARLTAPVVGPLEQAGWGDELLCYARRPA